MSKPRYEVRYLTSRYPGRFALMGGREVDPEIKRQVAEYARLLNTGEDSASRWGWEPAGSFAGPAWGILEITEPEINEWGEVAP